MSLALSGAAPLVETDRPAPAARPVPAAVATGGMPDAVLGMIVFLVTEVMLFCGLISAHIVLRGPAVVWPPMGQPRLPVEVTAVNTCFLFLSGYTMLRATESFAQAQVARAKRSLDLTLALGLLFVSVQGYEWVRLISYGLTTRSSLYGALFYTVVGAHALHVLGAVTGLVWVRRHLGASGLGAMKLYWLFVVGVWPALFVMVYLW